jgi:transcriptional regulator with XRE-family HTH domain
MQKLSRALRDLRESANLSRETLAEKADVSPAFIYKLETGVYSTLSIDKSRDLAKGLGLTFRDFLDAVGLLEDASTPNANAALASALRKRKLDDSQIKEVVSFVEFVERKKRK